MIRITIVELALVATPFLLYFAYRVVVNTRRAADGGPIDETPYQILFLTGSAVAMIALVASVILNRNEADPREQIYIPPRVVDGELVQGHFISREEALEQGLIHEGDRYFNPDEEADAAQAPDAPDPAPES